MKLHYNNPNPHHHSTSGHLPPNYNHHHHHHQHHHYHAADGGVCCRGRSWCSRETRQALIQLVLLCLASCSWTLLLISLTLTSHTSSKHSRQLVEVTEAPGPEWRGGSAGACEECLTRRGPPGTYWRVFQQPLQQVMAALDRLDQPLASPALRTQLLGARTLLRHLVTVLHLPLTSTKNEDQDTRQSEAAVLPAPGKPHERLACQERFLGSKAGYPRYHEGFTRVNCTAIPLHLAVTAVVWDVESHRLANLVKDFQQVYPGLPLRVVADTALPAPSHVHVHPPTPTLSHALTSILSQVTTPYVLLAPRLTHLNHHSRLERLLWVAEWSGVWAVGGSVRGGDGRWRVGCLQAREGGGQLVYHRGYQVSLYECQLCHCVEGPLVMRTAALASLPWPALGTHPHLLLPHLLLQVHAGAEAHQHGAAVCPDAMFLVTSLEPPWQLQPTQPLQQERELRRLAALWRPLVQRRHLSRLHLPVALTINYPCDFLAASRPAHATHTYPRASDANVTAAWACEGQEVRTVLSHILQACHVLDMKCFLQHPSLTALTGWDVRDLPGRNLTLGVTSADLLPRLITFANLTRYSTVSEDEGSMRVEGRWWTVIVTTTPQHQHQEHQHQQQHTRWTRVEVIPGLWVWTQAPTDTGKVATDPRVGVVRGVGGKKRVRDDLLPNLRVLGTAWEEKDDIPRRLLTSPRCAQGRATHLTLRSP